jgi:large repetitive protein
VLLAGPSHGTLVLNANGSFTYQPSPDFNGGDRFTYRATDGTAESNQATVSIAVRAVNDAPVAVSQSVTAETKEARLIVLAARDAEGSTLSYRVVGGPSNGTLSGVAPNLRYTPKKKFIGADSFTFVASDGVADSNIAAVSITVVKDASKPPVAYDQSVGLDEDDTLEFELKATDSGGEPSLKYQIVKRPAHGRLSASGRTVEYVPDRDFHGEDSFTFRVSNKVHESNVATVSISVAAVNDRPRVQQQEFDIPRGEPFTGRLRAADIDGDTLKYALAEAPRTGAVTIDEATGQFTYTPNFSPGAGDDDADRFTWVASDGKVNSEHARVTLEIDGYGYGDEQDD